MQNGTHNPLSSSVSDEGTGMIRDDLEMSPMSREFSHSEDLRMMSGDRRPVVDHSAYLRSYFNKGSISNMCTFLVMLIGMALKVASQTPGGDALACSETGSPAPRTPMQEAARWILAAGLFGFAGGITNWIAIKMLFDRVCNLPGSGVIPRQFKEIRQVIKDTIMKTFFDGPYLEAYMNKKMASLAGEINLGQKLKEVLETDEVRHAWRPSLR